MAKVSVLQKNFSIRRKKFKLCSHWKVSGVEETLYLLLLVAKKNRKSVDIQNNKGKVKIKDYNLLKFSIEKYYEYDFLNFFQTKCKRLSIWFAQMFPDPLLLCTHSKNDSSPILAIGPLHHRQEEPHSSRVLHQVSTVCIKIVLFSHQFWLARYCGWTTLIQPQA